MFKFDRLYGDGKVYDVEVYEVGKRQFKEFCSTLDNIVLSLCRARLNDYVVISAWCDFGHQPSYVDYDRVFRTLNRAIGYVHDMQESNLLSCQMRSSLNHGRHYEVWHIVDDDELWQGWESAVESSKTADDVCSEDAETKDESIIDKVNRLADEAQDNYDLYGVVTQGAADMLDYLNIYCGDYDNLTDDSVDAMDEFWDKLTVWDNRNGHACWNTLIDEETTAELIEYYSDRIWHEDGSLRLREC